MIQPRINILGDHYELPNMYFVSTCCGILLKGITEDFIQIYEIGDEYRDGKVVCCVCDNEGMGIGYMVVEWNKIFFEVSFMGCIIEPVWEQLPFKRNRHIKDSTKLNGGHLW